MLPDRGMAFLLIRTMNNINVTLYRIFMRGPRKFCQRGYKFDFFSFLFLVDGGIEDPNTATNGPPSAR